MVTTRSRKSRSEEPSAPGPSSASEQQPKPQQRRAHTSAAANHQQQQQQEEEHPHASSLTHEERLRQEHLKQLEAYRKEWAPPTSLHGRALRCVVEHLNYLNYLAGLETLDHSERIIFIFVVIAAIVLGLMGAYKQAVVLGRMLQPLVMRACDAALKRLR